MNKSFNLYLQDIAFIVGSLFLVGSFVLGVAVHSGLQVDFFRSLAADPEGVSNPTAISISGYGMADLAGLANGDAFLVSSQKADGTGDFTLAVKYTYQSAPSSPVERLEANDWAYQDAAGVSRHEITEYSPVGRYQIRAVKDNRLSTWVELGDAGPAVIVGQFGLPAARRDLIVQFESFASSDLARLKLGDRFAVRAWVGTNQGQQLLQNADLDVKYIGPDTAGAEKAVERWAHFDEGGISSMTITADMPAGDYRITSVRLHGDPDMNEYVAPLNGYQQITIVEEIKLQRVAMRLERVGVSDLNNLRANDQYLVRATDETTGAALAGAVIDVKYIGPDTAGEEKVVERWAALDGNGTKIMNITSDMPWGSYQITGVRMHSDARSDSYQDIRNAGLQIAIARPPAPPPPPAGQTSYRFTGLPSGVYREGQQFALHDFAIVINYFGEGEAHISVRLTDNKGLDFTYVRDNLNAPLVIDGRAVKKTVLLNVAGVAFPADDAKFEYHPDITVEINADQPVLVLPPAQFYASGYGATVAEAMENSWQAFGMRVPPSQKIGSVQYFPYVIYWRNLRAFPDGWDTRISVRNKSANPINAEMVYYPDYNRLHDPVSCESRDLGGEPSKNISVLGGGEQTLFLHDLLNSDLTTSQQTEGALGFDFEQANPNDLDIKIDVIPLTGGRRICAAPIVPVDVKIKPVGQANLESLQAGDQYSVHVTSPATGRPLSETWLDATYVGPDTGNQEAVVEKWVKLDDNGDAVLSVTEDMPPGEYEIKKVRLHPQGGEESNFAFQSQQTSLPVLKISEQEEKINPAPPARQEFKTGDLVNDHGTIYLIFEGRKIGFTNMGAFTGLGYSLKNVIAADLSGVPEESDYNISTASASHPWGSWLLYRGTVYYFHETGMIGVPSWQIFLANGGAEAEILPMNSFDLKILNQGNLPVMTAGDPRVYD